MLVQKLRLQKGWSQQQLADLSGLSVRTIQRIEQGQTASSESLKSLAAVFEVDFSTLLESTMHTPSRASDQINPIAGPDNDSPRSLLPHDEILALRHVRKLKDLYLHAAQYVIVVTAMAIFNLWKQPQYWWFLWVAFGWGTGLVVHAIRVLDWGPFGSAWERAQVEKRLGRKL
jgi:transcriptional regulator with XRE-family HTH domain